MNISERLREHLLSGCGVFERKPIEEKLDLCSLRKTEWSPGFERYMRNRLIMGALRYGLLNAKDKKRWDRLAAMEQRIDEYRRTHNKELLVDIANFCLLEFEEGDGFFLATENTEKVKECSQ